VRLLNDFRGINTYSETSDLNNQELTNALTNTNKLAVLH